MNILLTGGAGYIGSHTAVELLEAGHRVITADNYSNSSPEALERVERITGRHVTVYDIDITNTDMLCDIFACEEIDAAVHFAGLKAVGESVKEPLRYYRNNLDGTISLLEAMKMYGVKRLIFSSSATVYGTPEKLPFTEDMKLGPCTNPYGWTKLMSERIITDYAASYPEFSAVLLRYFNPVGAHPSGLIGEDPKDIPNNLMPYISQVASGRLDKLHVFGNDYPTKDGTGVRDYIHVVDLARGHRAALEYCAEHKGVQAVNLGTGVGYSVLEMVKTFAAVSGIDIPYQIEGRRDGDIAESYGDPSKALELFGWRAGLGPEDMCRDTWNWQKNNPNGYDG